MKIEISRPVGKKKKELRGYSIGELKEVNLSVKKARMLGIPVDERRRTVYKENVEILKEALKPLKR